MQIAEKPLINSVVDVTKLVKAKVHPIIRGDAEYLEYWAYSAAPAKGVLYITHENHEFISGHVRMRGRDNGRYPYNYLEMINSLFGPEPNTIEVCSGEVDGDCITVDTNEDCHPDYFGDGQTLVAIESNRFNRWRCDPPYNEKTAFEMYSTTLPSFSKLLTAGARVCKVGALMFFLLGPTNYQYCPEGVKRIGLIFLSIVPNNEIRCLNCYIKESEPQARLS